METKDWLLFFGPLLGVIIAHIFGLRLKRLELRHADEKENTKRIFESLEELYTEIENFLLSQKNFYNMICYSLKPNAKDILTAEDVKQAIDLRTKHVARIYLLQSIYAEQLDPKMIELYTLGLNLAQYADKVSRPNDGNLEEFKDIYECLTEKGAEVKQELAVIIKKQALTSHLIGKTDAKQ